MIATCITSPTIAANKYWGKRQNASRNTALHNNIAVVMGGLETKTTVRLGGEKDRFAINGRVLAGKDFDRLKEFADHMRAKMGFSQRVEMNSTNSYPTSSGLASSGAGFAALTLATARAAGSKLSEKELSSIAGFGSGSARRSVPFGGGFVEWLAEEGYARQIAPVESWPELRIIVGVATEGAKSISSTEAMERTQQSPVYKEWFERGEKDYQKIRKAVLGKDLKTFGETAEANARAMHELIRSTKIDYWSQHSWSMSKAIETLRASGVAAWWTSDAGPHIKGFCLEPDASKVEQALVKNGAIRTIRAKPGPGARFVEDHLQPV